MCAASPNRVRLGIVGAAAQGSFYAELITQGRVPHMMVGAMSGRSPATGALIAERFPEVAFFTDATELMDSGFAEDEPIPGLPRATGLAVGAALARVYEEVVRDRTAELPRLLPQLTYELLVPFVGEGVAGAEERRAMEMLAAAE